MRGSCPTAATRNFPDLAMARPFTKPRAGRPPRKRKEPAPPCMHCRVQVTRTNWRAIIRGKERAWGSIAQCSQPGATHYWLQRFRRVRS
eukprot:scaffold39786_cov21-Tisochrysis_lutea.AAC.1